MAQYTSVTRQEQGTVNLTHARGVARIQSGDIAQSGERCARIAEVGGSNPPISTRKFKKTGLSTLLEKRVNKAFSGDEVKGIT